MITIKNLLIDEMKANGETLDDIEASTLTEEILEQDVAVWPAPSCTAWTKKHIYFVVNCFTHANIKSVSRHPNL